LFPGEGDRLPGLRGPRRHLHCCCGPRPPWSSSWRRTPAAARPPRPRPPPPPQPRTPAPLRPRPPASSGCLLRLPAGRLLRPPMSQGLGRGGVSISSGRDLWHFPASGSPSPRSERSASPTFSVEVRRLGFNLPPVGPPPAMAPVPSPALLRRLPPPSQPPPPSCAGAARRRRPASGRGEGGASSSAPLAPLPRGRHHWSLVVLAEATAQSAPRRLLLARSLLRSFVVRHLVVCFFHRTCFLCSRSSRQLRSMLLVRSLHRYGPKAVTGWIPRPGRGRPTKPWLVGPRRTVL
jgi:hypothetical protein